MSKEILEIKMQAAINEFAAIAQQPLYKQAIETWLSDYKELWDESRRDFDLPPLEMIHGRARCEFDQIYRLFSDLMECYGIEVICAAVMSEYYSILSENKHASGNEQLQQWMRKSAQLDTNYSIIACLHYVGDVYGVTYVVAGDQFKNIIAFRKIFDEVIAHTLVIK